MGARLLASAIACRRHLVMDTHRTDLGVTRQACHYTHEMIVTANRTCVLLASEDMITQRIDSHLARAKRATVSVCKHLGDGRSETPAEKSLPNVRRETSLRQNSVVTLKQDVLVPQVMESGPITKVCQ